MAFPITSRIFSRFLDRGWIFSKIIGVLLVTFLVWFAASFHVLTFNYVSILTIISLISLLSFITLTFSHCSTRLAARQVVQLFNCSKQKLFLIVFEELMFFSCLLLWSYIRGFQPVIEGLEKYMDFGFINAILKSSYFPPHDMWLSGYTINYYYFGHLIAAVMTLLSNIPPEVVYNLMIAVIFAFCFTASFSLGINIFYQLSKNFKFQISNFKLIFVGLLTAYLVTNAANLQPIYHLLTKGSSTYWYPDATRFIVKKFGAYDETIHEFPHYSFVVADLHGHVSDIPTVLLLIGYIFVLFLKINEDRRGKSSEGEGSSHDEGYRKTRGSFDSLRSLRMALGSLLPLSIFDALLLGFFLSCAYMTNAMDGPVYFALSGLVVFGSYVFVGNGLDPLRSEASHSLLNKIKMAVFKTSLFFFFVSLTFVICSFPFLISFKNFTGAVTLVDFRSPLWMLGVLWGFQFFMFFCFFVFLFANKIGKRENLAKAVASFFGVKIAILNSKEEKKSNFFTIDLFIIFLFLMSLFLIVFPEIFYIKDIYIHEYERANTMFKMTYQAFIMLYISVPYIFFRILYYIKNHKSSLLFFPTIVFLCLSIFGILSVSIYPYFAVKSYYGLVTYQSLDGLKYLNSLYPDDYQLIKYINSHKLPENTILLEAVGDSYTKYARISANTGVSTVLGWPVHEWLWRNGYDIPGKRTTNVQKIYESTSLEETKILLKTYQVNYVWVGELEREKYKNLNESKFNELGKVFLKFGSSTLYKIN